VLNKNEYYCFPVNSTKKIVSLSYEVHNFSSTAPVQPCWYPLDNNYQVLNWDWHGEWINSGTNTTVVCNGLNLTGVSYIGFKENPADNVADTVTISNIQVTYEKIGKSGGLTVNRNQSSSNRTESVRKTTTFTGAMLKAESSVMGTRRITRLGVVTQVEEVLHDNEDIGTVKDALAVMPKIRLLGASPTRGNTLEAWQTVTLNATGNWTETVNLPAYDENGSRYYYWAVEEPVPGYTVSYQFSDGDSNTIFCINAEAPGDGEITVRNTKTESDDVTLPVTGSDGTKKFIITGALLLLLSTAGFVTIRRRRWFHE
jgi:LPXTG-motif cell wall-anchored protein